MSNTVKTTFIGDNRPMDKAVEAHHRSVETMQKDVARYEANRRKDADRLTQHLAKQNELQTRNAIKGFQAELQAAEKMYARRNQLEKKYADDRKTAFASFARLPGTGAISGGASALGVGLGLAGAVALTQTAIDKAVEQAKANRLLASAATEAGLAQGTLAEANKRFAASVGLSDVAAASTTAQIQRLTTNAGRPNDTDKILKSFADLGAARGIGGKDLETLIGTILSGQDEGLNKLGISDPGQLQKEFAKSIGTTTEALTQQQKVLAGLNAVVEKSGIFTGAAEARMNSIEGSVAKTNAAYENLTTGISAAFVQSYEFQSVVAAVSKALGDMNKEVESLADKAEKGINIDIEIQAQAKDSATMQTLKLLGVGVLKMASDLGGLLSPIDLVAPTRFGDASKNLRQAATDLIPEIQQQKQEEELRNRIRAEVADRGFQNDAAREQRLVNLNKQLKDIGSSQARKADEARLNATERLLSNPQATLAQLQAAQRGIGGLKGLTGDKALDLNQRFETEILQKLEEQKKKLEEIRQAKESLFDSAISGEGGNNPFLSFLGKANQEMRQLLETAKDLSPAMREAFVANAQRQNRNQLFGLRQDARVDADGLRRQAQEFRQGYRNDLSDPKTVQRILDEQLRVLGVSSQFQNGGTLPLGIGAGKSFRFDPRTGKVGIGDITSAFVDSFQNLGGKGLTPQERALQDQKLLNLAGGLDPALLRGDQQSTVASAFEREATRRIDSEKVANEYYASMAQIIGKGGLKVTLDKASHIIDIRSHTPQARVTPGTGASVQERYSN